MLLDTLLADVPPGAGNRVAVLLNGLGSTQHEELFVLYKDIHRRLLAEGLDAISAGCRRVGYIAGYGRLLVEPALA